MQFSVQLSFDDYLAANRLIFRRYWKPARFLSVFAATAALYFAVMLVIFASDGKVTSAHLPFLLTAPPLVAAAAIGGIVATGWLRMPAISRKTFREFATIELPTDYQFDDTRMISSNASGQAIVEYALFTDYLISQRLILLRRTRLIFFGFPRDRIEPWQDAELLRLIETHGIKRG